MIGVNQECDNTENMTVPLKEVMHILQKNQRLEFRCLRAEMFLVPVSFAIGLVLGFILDVNII